MSTGKMPLCGPRVHRFFRQPAPCFFAFCRPPHGFSRCESSYSIEFETTCKIAGKDEVGLPPTSSQRFAACSGTKRSGAGNQYPPSSLATSPTTSISSSAARMTSFGSEDSADIERLFLSYSGSGLNKGSTAPISLVMYTGMFPALEHAQSDARRHSARKLSEAMSAYGRASFFPPPPLGAKPKFRNATARTSASYAMTPGSRNAASAS